MDDRYIIDVVGVFAYINEFDELQTILVWEDKDGLFTENNPSTRAAYNDMIQEIYNNSDPM
jgi:hypothetical protein